MQLTTLWLPILNIRCYGKIPKGFSHNYLGLEGYMVRFQSSLDL
jgi:hypothetical protein